MDNKINYTDEDLKCYLACVDYFNYVEQNASNNLDITYEEVTDIFETLLCENMICM